MLDAVVIGAGIFGSLITRALRRSGLEVVTIDARRKGAGSPPAACLMRYGWFSALGKEVYVPALQKLDDLVGVQELTFQINNLKSATIQWCNPKQLLLDRSEIREGDVFRIWPERGHWLVSLSNQKLEPILLQTKLVIVAAGIWTKLLVPEIDVVGQAGVAWLWPTGKIELPKIKVWAPYKQLVAFNRGDGLWVGDGTSLQELDAARKYQSRIRCERFISAPATSNPRELFGYRPYVKGAKPCFLKEIKRGLWIATGGAKNGTLAAGWCADQIARAV
jgi:glycine/D-amino acid oxidase-like deaminating enzyme